MVFSFLSLEQNDNSTPQDDQSNNNTPQPTSDPKMPSLPNGGFGNMPVAPNNPGHDGTGSNASLDGSNNAADNSIIQASPDDDGYNSQNVYQRNPAITTGVGIFVVSVAIVSLIFLFKKNRSHLSNSNPDGASGFKEKFSKFCKVIFSPFLALRNIMGRDKKRVEIVFDDETNNATKKLGFYKTRVISNVFEGINNRKDPRNIDLLHTSSIPGQVTLPNNKVIKIDDITLEQPQNISFVHEDAPITPQAQFNDNTIQSENFDTIDTNSNFNNTLDYKSYPSPKHEINIIDSPDIQEDDFTFARKGDAKHIPRAVSFLTNESYNYFKRQKMRFVNDIRDVDCDNSTAINQGTSPPFITSPTHKEYNTVSEITEQTPDINQDINTDINEPPFHNIISPYNGAVGQVMENGLQDKKDEILTTHRHGHRKSSNTRKNSNEGSIYSDI